MQVQQGVVSLKELELMFVAPKMTKNAIWVKLFQLIIGPVSDLRGSNPIMSTIGCMYHVFGSIGPEGLDFRPC